MNRGFTYTNRIDTGAAGETVLDFYVRRYPHSSEPEWRERIEHGDVCLDGRGATPQTVLRAGQTLSYRRAPWTEPDTPMTFDVLYEDAHLIAVDKPSGLPVLPSGHHLEHTLLALVRARYGKASDVPPSPLHRLGRGTSGIVLFARTQLAARRLAASFAERRITKIYRSLVQGVGLPEEKTIDVPIGCIDYEPTRKLHAAARDGATARSICRLVHADVAQRRSLVEVEIVTGRPHQIRIHMAAIGHPLLGDPLYVAGGIPAPLAPGRRPPLPGDCGYHLHAARLSFLHPESSEPLDLSSPLPPMLRAPGESGEIQAVASEELRR